MDIYPHGTLVSVIIKEEGKPHTKYYGYVRKVEITERIRYFVQFHPDMPYSEYTAADLSMVEAKDLD